MYEKCEHSDEWWSDVQKNPVSLMHLALNGLSRKKVADIVHRARLCFPYLTVAVTTVPKDSDTWRRKMAAVTSLYSAVGFVLKFAVVEGSPLLSPLTPENTVFYPKAFNSTFRRRQWLEANFQDFIISDDDPGSVNRNTLAYSPCDHAVLVLACKALAGGGHQSNLHLTPDSFFLVWQVLFLIGMIEGVSYVGLNGSKQGTGKVDGYQGSGKKQTSHASYSVQPVTYDAAITGAQGVVRGVRHSKRYANIESTGVNQEYSTSCAEAITQGYNSGRHGTLTLRSIKCVFAVNPLAEDSPDNAGALHAVYPLVKTGNCAGGKALKSGCIVKFETSVSKSATSLRINA
jgi:hypothetical protein